MITRTLNPYVKGLEYNNNDYTSHPVLCSIIELIMSDNVQ